MSTEKPEKPTYQLSEQETAFLRQLDQQCAEHEAHLNVVRSGRQAAISLIMAQQGLSGDYQIDGGRTKLTPRQEANSNAKSNDA